MLLHHATFPSALPHNLASLPSSNNAPYPLRKPNSCCTSIRFQVGFENIAEIAHNKVLVAAGVSAAIGQVSKPFSSSILYGNNFDFKTAFQAGGFPSTHSSSVVAAATCLLLERGFSDSIFGITVVYAGLIMYDAQGVRREVGNHAKVLNRLLSKTPINSNSSDDRDDLIDSRPGTTSSLELESLGPLSSEETNSYTPKSAPLLLKSDDRLMSSSIAADVKEGSEKTAKSPTLLKESIGHTEIEVIAGALLGFFVSLVVYLLM